MLRFHPTGRYLLSYGERCNIWDLASEEALEFPETTGEVQEAAWSPEGERLVLVKPSGRIELRRFPSGELVGALAAPGPSLRFTFSPDGHYLAVVAGSLLIWDTAKPSSAPHEIQCDPPALHVTFSPGGHRLAVGSRDNGASVYSFDEASGAARVLCKLPPSKASGLATLSPAFVDGGRGLVTAASESGLVLWDTATGARLAELFDFPALGFTVSPDGRYVEAWHWSAGELWSIEDQIPSREFGSPLPSPERPRFAPDGTEALGFSFPQFGARRWRFPGGSPVSQRDLSWSSTSWLEQFQLEKNAVYSPDGRFVAATVKGGLVCVWERRRRGAEHGSLFSGDTGFGYNYAVLSPDGTHVLPISRGWRSHTHRTRVFDVETLQPAGPYLNVDGILTSAAIAPDGQHLVTLSSSLETFDERRSALASEEDWPGRLRFWDWLQGTQVRGPIEFDSEPLDAAFDPDGTVLVVVLRSGEILLLNVSGDPAPRMLSHGARASYRGTLNDLDLRGYHPPSGLVRFSPDGARFVTWACGSTAAVWDVASGSRTWPPFVHQGTVNHAAFSREGNLLVTASDDTTVVVWNLETGRPARPPLGHPAPVHDACFSPDGRLVLTACSDSMARVWNWRSGKLACAALKHDAVLGGRFAGDQSWALTVGDGFRVWDTHTGKAVTPLGGLVQLGRQILVTPDGRRAVVAGDTVEQHVFDLSVLASPGDEVLEIESLRRWGEILAGQQIDASGGAVNLTGEDWLERWRRFRRRYPGLAHVDFSREARKSWHLQEAEFFEQAHDWTAARWHLDRLRELGVEVEADRFARLEAFVRAWRFASRVVPWERVESFPPVDDVVLDEITASISGSKLVRARGPFVDFIPRLRRRKNRVAGYAARTIRCEENRRVRVLVGSDDLLRMWVNRQLVLENRIRRPAMADVDTALVELRKGENALLVEVTNEYELWGFYLRLEDEEGRRLRLTEDGQLDPLDAW